MVVDYKRAQSIVGTNNDGGRPDNDFYPTPPATTRALFRVESFVGSIWECASGDGAMSNVIAEFGHDVISTDLEPRNFGTQLDFLSSTELLAPNIVSNPPFKLFNEFIEKSFSLNPDKFALLGKLQALETQERTYLLERTGLTRAWIFRARQTLWRNGVKATKNGGMIAFTWLVWERGYTGKPTLGWV